MNAWLKISAGRWAALGVTIALLSSVFVVRQRGLLSGHHLDSKRMSLEAEKLRLAPFGAEVVQMLQAELAQIQQRGAAAEMVVPAGWRIEPLLSDPSSEPHVRYVRQGGEFSWTELVVFIAQCEAHAGVVSLDIQSQGTTRQRSIARVEIIVRGTPGTTRRQTGATFPDAFRAGRVPEDRARSLAPPSLRLHRTAAPPGYGFGPVSAPSRPDPPGSAGQNVHPSCSPEPQLLLS